MLGVDQPSEAYFGTNLSGFRFLDFSQLSGVLIYLNESWQETIRWVPDAGSRYPRLTLKFWIPVTKSSPSTDLFTDRKLRI